LAFDNILDLKSVLFSTYGSTKFRLCGAEGIFIVFSRVCEGIRSTPSIYVGLVGSLEFFIASCSASVFYSF
jgi:hypothetical protein